MASFIVEGAGEALVQLEKADLFDDETVREMLFAGGDILVDEIQRAMQQDTHKISHLAPKVRYKRTVKKGKDGVPYIAVSAEGKNRTGDRNSTILFVLNYGRSPKFGRITGSYFWTKAVQSATPKISAKYQEIVNKILNERGVTD